MVHLLQTLCKAHCGTGEVVPLRLTHQLLISFYNKNSCLKYLFRNIQVFIKTRPLSDCWQAQWFQQLLFILFQGVNKNAYHCCTATVINTVQQLLLFYHATTAKPSNQTWYPRSRSFKVLFNNTPLNMKNFWKPISSSLAIQSRIFQRKTL